MRILLLFTFLLASQYCTAQLSNQLDFQGFQSHTESNIDNYISTAEIGRNDLVNNRYYKVLQFDNLLTKEEKLQLQKSGLRILDYIPNKAYLVSIPQSYDPYRFKSFRVNHVMNIEPKRKIDRRLIEDDIPSWAKAGSGKVKVIISYPTDLKQNKVFELCALENIEPIAYNGHNTCFTAELEIAKLEEYAALPFIMNIERGSPPPVPDDTPGRSLLRANLIDSPSPMGRKYDGEGVAVLCRDDGKVFDHVDFHGRLFQNYNEEDPRTHGDGVSGIMCGAGNRIPKNRGMARGADLYVINYSAEFLDNTLSLHRNQNVLVTNSSYSDGCNVGYTATTRTVDQQCFDNETLMHVFSAGNSNGFDCDEIGGVSYGAGNQWGNVTGGHKHGKNVLTVANTTNRGNITESSSRGPAFDGRIKPDISANGIDHISTDNDHAYFAFGGTSAAAPCIAGVMAMLHDAYKENNNGETADAALLKSILLNTADDVGNKGPDFIYGWGIANAYRSALTIEDKRYLKGTINQGEEISHTISVPAGVKELRVMTYWRDPAASIGTSKALINDIDTEVISMDGSSNLPWVLDSSPNPILLALPATRGNDKLNNMEQVFIENPEAGDYTLNLNGFAIPAVDHKYIVTWEFRTEDITIVYPSGGEKLYASDREVVYWETVPNGLPQNVSISIDGGSNWIELGEVGPTVQYIQFSTPLVNSGAALMRIERGSQTVISDPFVITSLPTNVNIQQVCASEMVVSWTGLDEAESYDVHLLGEKYMEVYTNTATTSATVPIDNPFEVQWVAVSANFPNGVKGQRTIAKSTEGNGLKDCIQDFDLSASRIINPDNNSLITCDDNMENTISLEIVNEGIMDLSQITASYQLNDEPIVTEIINTTLEAGDTLIYDFINTISFQSSGEFSLKTWISNPMQDFFLNDSISISGPVYIESGETLPFIEEFDEGKFPEFWDRENPDGSITWVPILIQKGFSNGEGVIYISNENYFDRGQIDYLYMTPLDLSAETNTTVLEFDHAYFYNQAQEDGLLIEVSTDCGMTFPDTIYSKFGDALATTYSPISQRHTFKDWTTEQIDLSAYNGLGKVILRFVGVNDIGSSLYLDNINVKSIEIQEPKAEFLIGTSTFCPLTPVPYESFSTGGLLEYDWNFGASALPPTSDKPGPHDIQYLFPGEKKVTLTVSNALGSSTFEQTVTIIDKPNGSWSYEETSNGRVKFTSNVNFANQYYWEFGDGSISFMKNPIHQFQEPGEYTVNLLAINACGESNTTKTITVATSSVNELEKNLIAAVIPNPNNGQFSLSLEGTVGSELDLKILNLNGQLVESSKLRLNRKQQLINFSDIQFDAGVYFIELSNQLGVKTVKMVVVD